MLSKRDAAILALSAGLLIAVIGWICFVGKFVL